jgi:hypothetical protein
MKKLGALLVLLSAIPAGAAATPPSAARITGRRVSRASADRAHAMAVILAASGLGVNNPVIGRLVGNGGVLYRTAFDVENNTNASHEVDYFFDGATTAGSPIQAQGTIASPGSSVLAGYDNVHFDDFIDALRQGGQITQAEEDAGVVGSVVIIFDCACQNPRSGSGSTLARFYSDYNGGTIGVSAKGTEVTTDNPLKLIGVVRDTRGEAGVPQLYANIFINNIGYSQSGGTPPNSTDTVTISAISTTTGQAIGTAIQRTIALGQVATVSDVFFTLGIPTSEDTVLVLVNVDSGDAAIEALTNEVDNTTKDGSAAEMSRADF